MCGTHWCLYAPVECGVRASDAKTLAGQNAMRRHVWLPTLGVWAEANELPSERNVTPDAGQSFRTRSDHSNAASCSSGARVSPQFERRKRPCVRDEGPCSLDRRHRGDCSRQYERCCFDVDEDLNTCEDTHHTCPICLSSISQSDLAVLQWCMHRFCLTCIEKWSAVQRFCPLCKQTFCGWYCNIRSSTVFEENAFSHSSEERRGERRRDRYSFSRSRISHLRHTSRTFDHPQRVVENEVEEAIRWRASIYAKNLRAIPCTLRSRVKVNQLPPSNPERKARIERRLEPWIRRELQAVAGDLDYSLLIQLILALWLRFISDKEQVLTTSSLGGQPHKRVPRAEFVDADASRQLEPFLQEKATLFWHELRCFAESPYSFRAYDSVVKYKKKRE